MCTRSHTPTCSYSSVWEGGREKGVSRRREGRGVGEEKKGGGRVGRWRGEGREIHEGGRYMRRKRHTCIIMM